MAGCGLRGHNGDLYGDFEAMKGLSIYLWAIPLAFALMSCQSDIIQLRHPKIPYGDRSRPGMLGVPYGQTVHVHATLVYGDDTLFALQVDRVETNVLSPPAIMIFSDDLHRIPANNFQAYELLHGNKTGHLLPEEIIEMRGSFIGRGYELIASEDYRFHLKVIAVVSSVAPVHNAATYDTRETESWKKLKAMHPSMPRQIKVLSATELDVNGVRCRLFGIAPKKDQGQIMAAQQLLECYFETYGGYFSISNELTPVNDVDGVPLIWLQGAGPGGWAQEVLVQAGLADVAYAGFENYTFYLCSPKSCGDKPVNWQQIFRTAEAQCKDGGQLDEYFEWVPSHP